MGADIKQVLEQDYNIELSAKEIRDLTFNALSELAADLESDDENKVNVVNAYNITRESVRRGTRLIPFCTVLFTARCGRHTRFWRNHRLRLITPFAIKYVKNISLCNLQSNIILLALNKVFVFNTSGTIR